MEFKEFDKQLKGIKHKAISDWVIELPFDSDYKPIIAKAREHLLTKWHIVIPQPTDENPKPAIKMYWDKA